MRVALVHDYLAQFGGGERVLKEISRLFPGAPIYTSVYSPAAFDGAFDGVDIRTSWLQHVPGAARNFRALLLLYPGVFERFDFRGYDLVVSSTTSFAKGIRVHPKTLHVCYMNTPTRFLWRPDEYGDDMVPALARPLYRASLPGLRRWDLAAAQRPHFIVANSANVASRISAIYGRNSDVVHCPASIDGFERSSAIDDYYIVASRLLRYKRIELAIEASALVGAPLRIIGAGPDEARLRRIAGPHVRFLGRVDDARRKSLFARARAVIVPGIEDFGLVPIEAAAAGRPVVAFAAGGALEPVVEGETGIYFREPTPQALAQALRSPSLDSFDPDRLAAHARSFSPERFRSELSALIDRYRTEFQRT